MLRITNTDNLMGIVIHGDYDDLDALRDALGRCAEFCYEEKKRFCDELEHDQDDTSYKAQKEQEYEFFLSLNYDIRHAFQGDRNYELRENWAFCFNDKKTFFSKESDIYRKYEELYELTKYGNLQYSVEILYPMALYYLHTINDFIYSLFDDSFLDHLTFDYAQKFSFYPAKSSVLYQDIGILLQFRGLLQGALEEVIGENRFKNLSAYMNESWHSNTSTLYPEALCSYYCNSGLKASKPARKAMILLMAYELFDSGMLIGERGYGFASKDYNAAAKTVIKQTGIPFPGAHNFNIKLNQFVDQLSTPFYYEDFDRFLEQEFGPDSDDQDIFGTDPWPECLRQKTDRKTIFQ